MDFGILAIFAAIFIAIFMSVKVVPQQQVWIVERLGKFFNQVDAGLQIIIPFVDRIAYKHTLKERAIDVMEQTAITKDNVTLHIDGVLYVRIINPKDASYGVENPYYAVTQLAQTSMRSAIGKIPLDKTFEEREYLNVQIVNTINEAATNWGIQCMRYEIRDIKPPATVLKAMELQVAAERQKRAVILESEGRQQSQINIAEAEKQSVVLTSEAAMTDQINRAKGQSEAITLVAQATSSGISYVAKSINDTGGTEAVSLRVAEQYVDAFKELAKKGNTIIVPANANDTSAMVAQALSIFGSIKGSVSKKAE
ncbi:MAG: SPFH domain-containing protein [Alphaproteobacteria bacterium]|jgi:regulator of protease activity HflC (stomatin/prohibitin superfamily)|nr:paraslipin [Candidatus Jidaibacter sp.]